MSDAVASVDDVREVVLGLAVALRERGLLEQVVRLEEAAEGGTSPSEELLVMREALVVTRAAWDGLPEGAAARAALAAAKRTAIDL